MKKEFVAEIECPSCKGTGIYSGMGEGVGVGVICNSCDGTGRKLFVYYYKDFVGRKKRNDIKRVYKSGSRFKLGLGKINFEGIGVVDMDNEGISYEEFLQGEMPSEIESIDCPMIADQGACHEIPGFVDKCNELHGGSLWGIYLYNCSYQPNKKECWKRFKSKKN